MKKLTLIFISLFFMISACTKTDLRIQGFVKTNKGMPVKEVTLSIQKNKKIMEAQTDQTGFYMIENIPVGVWALSVNKEGYETITETISLSNGNGGNIYHKDYELIKKKP